MGKVGKIGVVLFQILKGRENEVVACFHGWIVFGLYWVFCHILWQNRFMKLCVCEMFRFSFQD